MEQDLENDILNSYWYFKQVHTNKHLKISDYHDIIDWFFFFINKREDEGFFDPAPEMEIKFLKLQLEKEELENPERE